MLVIPSTNVHNNVLSANNVQSLCINDQVHPRSTLVGITRHISHIQNVGPENIQSFNQFSIQNIILNFQENNSFNQSFLSNQPYDLYRNKNKDKGFNSGNKLQCQIYEKPGHYGGIVGTSLTKCLYFSLINKERYTITIVIFRFENLATVFLKIEALGF